MQYNNQSADKIPPKVDDNQDIQCSDVSEQPPKNGSNQTIIGSVIQGATANAIGGYITLPLMEMFVLRQTTPMKFSEIAKKTFSLTGLKQAYIQASPAFFKWAPFKSTAYLGVSTAVFDHYHPSGGMLGEIKKGFAAGCASAVAESLVDAYGWPKVIAKLNQQSMSISVSANTAFFRCYRASLAKNTVANSLTLSVIYVARQYLEENTDLSPSARFAIAGFIGPVSVGMLFAPLVYLESNTAKNPSKPMSSHLKDVMVSGRFHLLWRGAVTRIIQRSTASGITFFALAEIKRGLEMIDKYNQLPR